MNCNNKDLQRRKKKKDKIMTYLKSLKLSKKAVLTLCQLR